MLPAEACLADWDPKDHAAFRPAWARAAPASDPTGPMADMGGRSSVVGGNPGTLTERRFIYITRSSE